MPAEEIEIEDQPPKKPALPLKWIIPGIIVLAVLIGGVIGYLLLKPSVPDGPVKTAAPVPKRTPVTAKKDFPQIYPLESMVVNLNDPGGKRYLKTTIELESATSGFADELNANLPRIKDAILMVLSNKSLADVQSMAGKLSLRKELILNINKVLNKKQIRNLYFTEFVIQ